VLVLEHHHQERYATAQYVNTGELGMLKQFGTIVRVRREKKGWTQEHLAEVAHLSSRTISRLEAGENIPSPETRLALAQAFDCTVEDLLYPKNSFAPGSKVRNYILEIYFEGDCIEQRRSQYPYIVPDVGDEMYVEFQNPVYSEEHGSWWRVNKKRHLKFALDLELETLMLYCEPCKPSGPF
jgi:transcriptional regulator with XRE-family HTH domain